MRFLLLALSLAFLIMRPAWALDPFKAAGIDRKPDAQVPFDLPFKDEHGAETTLRRLAGGKPVLLVPVQHHCPNLCGLTLAGLLQAVKAQPLRPGADFTILAFGIDPKETPPDAADSLGRLLQGSPTFPRDAIHGLTGGSADIAAVTDALGYRYAWDPQLAQFDHVAAIAVLASDGRLARWLYGVAPEPRDLQLALTEARQGETGSWTDQLILLCYHYDPATGRYSNVIWTSLRILAVVTLAGLAVLIGWTVYRNRHLAGGGRS
jgi:protein SCO1/2